MQSTLVVHRIWAILAVNIAFLIPTASNIIRIDLCPWGGAVPLSASSQPSCSPPHPHRVIYRRRLHTVTHSRATRGKGLEPDPTEEVIGSIDIGQRCVVKLEGHGDGDGDVVVVLDPVRSVDGNMHS